MPRDYELYVNDILESIKNIEDYTKDFVYNNFIKNKLVIDAVIRNLEIIGEAVKEIPIETKKKYPEIDWKKVVGLRDIITHKYFGIDTDIIWDIVINKIPELKVCITDIIKKLNNTRKK